MPDTFYSFGLLPPEIRAMVWEHALPDARVYEVMDVPGARQTMAATAGLMFAQAHDTPPPQLAATCREARRFVLERYRPLVLGRTTKYVDLGRDLLLLEPYLLRRRLLRTLRFLGRIPLVHDRLATLALGTSFGVHSGVCHPALGGRLGPDCIARLLAALARFPRLRTLLFVVHQEFQFEFGPGGEADVHMGMAPSIPVGGTVFSRLDGVEPLETLEPSRPIGPPEPLEQVVHQAYRFKFDIETSINRQRRRRPHLNELLFYPLDDRRASRDRRDSRISCDNDKNNVGDDDGDDWDELLRGAAVAAARGSSLLDESVGWCDPWPTNEDWRRFKRSFQRAVVAVVVGGGRGDLGGHIRGRGSRIEEKLRQRCGSDDSNSSSNSSGSSGSSGGLDDYAGPLDFAENQDLRCSRFKDGLNEYSRGCDRRSQRRQQSSSRHNLPAIKGASLLWRYMRE